MRKSDIAAYFYIGFMLVAFIFAAAVVYFRVSGDLAVCREYYPKMGRAQCYFSSKTVRVPGK